jgi:hypothetical protein
MDTSIYCSLNHLVELQILLTKLNVVKDRQTVVELWVKTYNSYCISRAAKCSIKMYLENQQAEYSYLDVTLIGEGHTL